MLYILGKATTTSRTTTKEVTRITLENGKDLNIFIVSENTCIIFHAIKKASSYTTTHIYN